jgi:hypothetical protein
MFCPTMQAWAASTKSQIATFWLIWTGYIRLFSLDMLALPAASSVVWRFCHWIFHPCFLFFVLDLGGRIFGCVLQGRRGGHSTPQNLRPSVHGSESHDRRMRDMEQNSSRLLCTPAAMSWNFDVRRRDCGPVDQSRITWEVTGTTANRHIFAQFLAAMRHILRDREPGSYRPSCIWSAWDRSPIASLTS